MKILISVLLAASLGFILWIIGRHLKELRLLNLAALPKEQEKKVKISILKERLKRNLRAHIRNLKQKTLPFTVLFKKMGEKFRSRIEELEITYEKAKRLTLGSRGKRTAQILGLIREAEEFRRQGKPEDAEKKYIAVISLDHRNVDAYEGLGNLYLEMRKYDEAGESLNFILKFRPNDASVITSLGEVRLAEGKNDEAMIEFRRAAELRQANPKYLDYLIETAILVGNKREAESGLKMMKQTNPENQKIGEWEQKLLTIDN